MRSLLSLESGGGGGGAVVAFFFLPSYYCQLNLDVRLEFCFPNELIMPFSARTAGRHPNQLEVQ